MHIAYTAEQQALRDELRSYFERLVTPEVATEMAQGEMGGPHCREAVRAMGRDGWLGLGWPVEYGGHGKGPVEQFIFFDETQRAGAPVPFLTINTVGPALMRFGTAEMRRDILPRILGGECFFSVGYTEPDAGTDLAALRTRAVRDGDEWVIDGQKVFTSLTDHADYIWLAARTDPDAPKKHRGISIILVPTEVPGFSYTTIETIGDTATYATYYDGVRVPVANTVGEVDRGWDVIITQLNYERVSLAAPGQLERLYTETLSFARRAELADGRRVIDQEWARVHLARVHAKLAGLRLLNWKVVASDAAGRLNPADASATKVYGTELYCEAYGLLLEVVGAAGALNRGSPDAALAGRLERAYRGTLILTFGGGTNEIQRDLIAIFGLDMPRSLR